MAKQMEFSSFVAYSDLNHNEN